MLSHGTGPFDPRTARGRPPVDNFWKFTRSAVLVVVALYAVGAAIGLAVFR